MAAVFLIKIREVVFHQPGDITLMFPQRWNNHDPVLEKLLQPLVEIAGVSL